MTITLRMLTTSAAICLGFASISSSFPAQEPNPEVPKAVDSPARPAVEDQPLAIRQVKANEELEALRKRLARLEQITANPNDPAVIRAKQHVLDAEEVLKDLTPKVGAANPEPLSGEALVLKKLETKDSPRIINQNLGEVLEYLEKRADLKINAEPKALEAAGVTLKTSVNLRGKDIKIETALLMILEPLGLSYRIEGDGLLVTGQESTAIASKPRDRAKDELERLRDLALKRIEALEKSTKDGVDLSWSINETKRWLNQIEAALALPDEGHRPEAAELLLDMYMGVNVRDKTLGEALEIVRKDSGLEIVVDWEKLREDGITTETPICGFAGTLSLGHFLNGILRPIGLAAMVEGQRLIVRPTPISLVAKTLGEIGPSLTEWRKDIREALEKNPGHPEVIQGIEAARRKFEAIEAAVRQIDRIANSMDYASEEKKADPIPNRVPGVVSSDVNRDPEVKPAGGDVGDQKYSVEGEAAKPGNYAFSENDTVLDAINRAGGIIAADLKVKIVVIRPASGKSLLAQTLPVDLVAIVERGETTTNHRLQPGDRLVISSGSVQAKSDPETRLKEVERKLDSILQKRELRRRN